MATKSAYNKAFLASVAAFVLSSSGNAAGVINGDFETGNLTGWKTASDDGAYSSTSASAVTSYLLPDGTVATARSGNYFALLQTNIDPNEIYNVTITLDQVLQVAAGTTIQGFFRFATYLPNPSNTFAYAIDRSQSPQKVFYMKRAKDVNYYGDTGWQSFTYTTAKDNTKVGFQLIGFNPYAASSYLMIDDVKVAAVPEPTGWAMAISGFGLVGATMRRRRTTTSVLHA